MTLTGCVRQLYLYRGGDMRKAKLMAALLCLGMATAPVSAKEITTNTNPEAYGSVAELEKAVRDWPAVERLGFVPYKKEKDKGTYVIPGLSKSASLSFSGKPSTCTSMTPQGVTETEDWLLISAYCHDHVHHSVIWVLDKDTHEFVKTVILDGMPHTGSIAWDETRNVLWVATHVHRKATASTIPMEELKSATDTKAVKWGRTFELDGLPVDSCLCMDKDQLVAGTFEKAGSVHIKWYDVGKEKLTGREEKIRGNKTKSFGTNLQGIAVSGDHIITAASDGPHLTSTLSIFPKDMEDLDSPVAVAELPPRLEQVSVSLSGTKLYANFESAASAYREEGVVVDRILSLDLEKLLKDAQ